MKRNIKELIRQMTISEKAGLCSGADAWSLKSVERLGVNSVMVADGPNGLRKQITQEENDLGVHDNSIQAVCFPAACAMAASFDEKLLQTVGEALGEECRAEDIAILLGPAVNIKRSPLGGRNFEYFSEDPYLTGKLAAAQVRGIQSWNVGACVKHFAANNQEYCRMSCSAEIDERTLREIYLSPFEIIVKEARPQALMCSYNRINGVFSSENPHILSEILRKEWGFEGFVMSDWGAVNDRVKGLAAGLDLEMPGSGCAQDERIVQAVVDGTLKEEVLDTAVYRIEKQVFQYIDHPRPEAVFDRNKHHALAVEMEKQCAVLLQNKGALPLSRIKHTVFIGPFAEKPRFQGGGSSHVRTGCCISGALQIAHQKGADVQYVQGFPIETDSQDTQMAAQALAVAGQAEAVVIFAGLPDNFESEGYDRKHMRLPDCQNKIIEEIAAIQPNTVVVLHNGSPVECPWAEQVNAVLEMYLGGEGVGEAAEAILYGETNPSGRLPETFPLRLQDNPSYLNFPGDGKTVHYAEGVFVGYRYYDKKQIPVQWPFGHGLSYTDFAYGKISLSCKELTDDSSITVTVPVRNVGQRAGAEVVQLYVADMTGTPQRPERELKGFAKLWLQPGEEKNAVFTLNARSLSWYSEEFAGWYAASGSYRLCVGHSSRDIRSYETVIFHTDKTMLKHVDENTTVRELAADRRTAAIIERCCHKT